MLKIIKAIACVSSPTAQSLLSRESVTISCRWAGHSKWANIKHQKAAQDAEKTKTFSRLTRMIKVAVAEGKSADPEANSQLASVIGQCRRVSMPATTINNALKSANASKATDETIGILEIRGPGRCALLIEVASSNLAHFKTQAASVMKKHACTYEKSVTHDYFRKGILIADPLKDSKNVIDDATDHAIAAGAEDVSIEEGSGKIKFECSPEVTWKAKKALEEQGYCIESAVIEYLPTVKAKLSEDQMELLQKFIVKMELFPEVMKITDNVE